MGAGALAAIPGGAPVAAVVAGVVKGIGALVKYLVSYFGEDNGVPGLAAMMPDGPFVTDLNKLQPGQPEPGTNWFVIASNFHVELLDDSHRPPEFPRELVVRLAEGFVDDLFKGDNDLVVDTASMSAIGLPTGGFVAEVRLFETNDADLPHQLLQPGRGHRGDRRLASARDGGGGRARSHARARARAHA